MAPPGFKLPPPKKKDKGGRPKGSSGGGGGSSSSGGGGSAQKNLDPWVVIKNGRIKYVSSINPPPGALKVFGLPARRSDFQQARSHYNDMFRSWLGRPANPLEVARILRSGASDFAVRKQMVQKRGFLRSPMYKDIRSRVTDLTGMGEFRPSRALILDAMKAEGGLSDASLKAAIGRNRQARVAVRRSFMDTSGADVQYLAGAFGQGNLNVREREALALQKSGLRATTMGAKLEGALEAAMRRMERAFQGTLAQPNLSLGPAGLQATSLNPNQEVDLPA